MTIVHTVLAQWRATVEASAGVETDRLVRERIPGIRGVVSLASGPSVSSEGLEGGFDWAMTVVFESRAALDDYLPHPDHLVVATHLRESAERIVVFDVEG